MTPLLRTMRGPVLVVGALVVTLWAAVGVALADPGEMRIVLAAGAGPDYDAGGERFRPVSLDLVRTVLGDADLETLLGVEDRGRSRDRPFSSGDDGSREQGGGTDPPPPARPALATTMAADRDEVDQGERVVFTVTVVNVGTADAQDIVMTSHVPAGTELASGDACSGATVGVDPSGGRPLVCVDQQPGLVGPPSEQHIYHTLLTPLAPGDRHRWSFTVRVRRTTEDGALLLNHAHASARGVEEVASNQVVVAVV